MYQKAKNPDRIVEKIYECRYFLALMADYEEKLDAEKLLYCLSAFLSAFRTSAFRLYGVTEHKLGGPRVVPCKLSCGVIPKLDSYLVGPTWKYTRMAWWCISNTHWKLSKGLRRVGRRRWFAIPVDGDR